MPTRTGFTDWGPLRLSLLLLPYRLNNLSKTCITGIETQILNSVVVDRSIVPNCPRFPQLESFSILLHPQTEFYVNVPGG